MASQDDISLVDGTRAERLDLARLARDLLGSRQDAEDVAQDVWLLYQREPPGRVRSLAAWFRVAILHLGVRSRQRERQRMQREKRVARANLAPSVVEQIERKGEQEFLADIVEELGAPYREVVRLRYLEDLEIEEIAARLGRSPGTVRSQLKRGLDLLRVRLGGQTRHRGLSAVFARLWRRRPERPETMASLAAGTRPVLVWGIAACVLMLTGLFVALRAQRGAPVTSSRLDEGGNSRVSLATSALPSRTASLARPALLPQAPAEGVWTVEVGGRVLDPDGTPIPGAAVLVGSVDGSDASVAAHSDELGYYRIDAVDRRLLIWAEDRERASSERQLICSSSLDQVDLRLGYPVGTLTGRILSFEGHPVPRAEVVLIGSFKRFVAGDARALSMPALPARVWTEGDGSFRLGLPSTRKARLLVLADGHAPLVRERAGQDLTLTLPAPCRLEGTLLQPDGSPACGARLGLVFPDPLPERETTTDQAGTFRFDNLPSGPHVLRLLADLDSPSLFLEGGLAEGERARRTVRLAEEHTIRGRALDGNSPLAGWTVELEDLQNKEEFRRELRRTRTGADGRFAFPSCSLANAHALRLFDPAAAHGMAAVAREVRAGNGALTLRPGDATSRPGSIVGRLESHDPILRPRIATLRGDSLTEPLLLLVDPVTGDFSAAPLPPGWYSLRAWITGSGLWNAAQTIEIHPGRQAEFFVQVPEPGRLVVRLDVPEDTDWAELNAPYIAPSFHDSDSEAHSLRLKKCREESSLKADLFPGNYTYSLRRGRVVLETRRVTIEPGRTTIENVPLREGVSVVLRLSFPRGLEEKEEVVLCTREEDQQRTIGLPHRYRASAATNRVLLTPDTEELRVRTSLGLTGRFAVTGADIRPNAELHIRLEECASD